MTTYLLNTDNPTGFYFSFMSNRENEDFCVVEDEFFDMTFHEPSQKTSMKRDHFKEDFYHGKMDDNDEIILVHDNPNSHFHDDSRSLISSAVGQDIPISVISDFTPFGGVKDSNYPVSQADNFYPRYQQGFDNTWLANFIKAHSIFNRNKVRMVIQPTSLSPLSHLEPSAVSNAGLAMVLDDFVKAFKFGGSVPLTEEELEMQHDIVHPIDTYNVWKELRDNRKRGVFVMGSYDYPLSVEKILKIAGKVISFSDTEPTLETLPVEIVEESEWDHQWFFPTHTDPSKLTRKTQWFPMFSQEEIVEDMVSAMMEFDDKYIHEIATDILF